MASVDVQRLTDVDDGPVVGFTAEIRAECIRCGAPAIWFCPDFGLMRDRPSLSVDGQTLHAPLRLATDPTDFGLQLPGLTMRVVEGPSPN